MITAYQDQVFGLVVKNEGEHSSQFLWECNIRTMLSIKRKDNLAIRTSLGLVGILQSLIKILVVVDLSISCNNNIAILANKRLLTRLRVHDRETLVSNSMTKGDAGVFIL